MTDDEVFEPFKENDDSKFIEKAISDFARTVKAKYGKNIILRKTSAAAGTDISVIFQEESVLLTIRNLYPRKRI